MRRHLHRGREIRRSRKKLWIAVGLILAGLALSLVLISYFMPQLVPEFTSSEKEEYLEFPFTYMKIAEGHQFEITIIKFFADEKVDSYTGGYYHVAIRYKHLGHRRVDINTPIVIKTEIVTNRGNFYEGNIPLGGFGFIGSTSFGPEEEGSHGCRYSLEKEGEYPKELKVIEGFTTYTFKLGPKELLQRGLIEDEIFRLINEKRKSHNLSPYEWSWVMERFLANPWAEYLAKNNSRESLGHGNFDERVSGPPRIACYAEIVDYVSLSKIGLVEYELRESEKFLAEIFVNKWLDNILFISSKMAAVAVSQNGMDFYVVVDFGAE